MMVWEIYGPFLECFEMYSTKYKKLQRETKILKQSCENILKVRFVM